MKKSLVVISLLVMVALVLTATQSMAASANAKQKPTTQPPGNSALKGTVSPGQGQQMQVGKKFHFRGIIAAASAESITLTLTDSTMTFTMSPTVKIRVPTLKTAAKVEDLQIGLQATVQAEKTDTGYIARMVIVVPGKPSNGHHVGDVLAYTAGESLTIVDKFGVETTFKLTAETEIILLDPTDVLEVGSRVTVVAPRDQTTTQLTALAVVVHRDPLYLLKATSTPTPSK